MIAEIKKSTACGEVFAPTSKSMAHRLIICAALAHGKSVIKSVTFSEDIYATIDCAKALGAKIEVCGDSVTVYGAKNIAENGECEFNCRESGSTLRFFVPLALLGENKQTFYGKGRLMQRPMQVYQEICRQKGLSYTFTDCLTVKGRLTGGEFTVSGSVSSQFISGLLFSLPLTENGGTIHIKPPLESRSYINMTVDSLNTFGVKAQWTDEFTIFVPGGQRYEPKSLTVEGDYSGAAFLDAFNLLGGSVTVLGMNKNSLQGDKIYLDYFRRLADGSPTLDVTDCPDLAPVLMTLAAAKNGARLTGTARLKIKESDRGTVMALELKKFGVSVTVEENEITVAGGELHAPNEILLGHNDHRVVMSLAVLAARYGGKINDAQAVKKSFPNFFDKIKQLGVEVLLYDD